MEVRVQGENISQEEFKAGTGWSTVSSKKRTVESHATSDFSAHRTADSRKQQREQKLKRQLVKASRMPYLPKGDYKIIIRPKGRLNIAELGAARVASCVYQAAGIPGEQREGRHRVPERTAEHYRRLKVPSFIHYGGALIKCALYRKQLDLCHQCGRLGNRMDVCPSPQDRICRGCGTANPGPDHQCNPCCQLCGGEHLTADKQCKARFKMPYIVKRRRCERQRQREEEILAWEATREAVWTSLSGRPSPVRALGPTHEPDSPNHGAAHPLQHDPGAVRPDHHSHIGPYRGPAAEEAAGRQKMQPTRWAGQTWSKARRVASDLGRLQLLGK
ncbi:hypothetical protein MTO96_045017 [Rhipicephalus appendiculatus]